MTKDPAQRSLSALLKAVSMSNGPSALVRAVSMSNSRWAFYEAVKKEGRHFLGYSLWRRK